MASEQKKPNAGALAKSEFKKPLISKKLAKSVAYSSIAKQQYLRDPKYRTMVNKLRNAFLLGKIGPERLKEYARTALENSIDRTAVRWVGVDFFGPPKEPGAKTEKPTTKKKPAVEKKKTAKTAKKPGKKKAVKAVKKEKKKKN